MTLSRFAPTRWLATTSVSMPSAISVFMIYLPRIQMIVSTSPRQTVPPAFVPVGTEAENRRLPA